MSFLEEELYSLFQQMTPAQQQELVDKAYRILHPPRTYTGQELMALPPEERARLVSEARSTQERMALSIDPNWETENQDDEGG